MLLPSFVLPSGAALPQCEAVGARASLASVRVIAAPAQVAGAVRCGLGARVVVEPDVEDAALAQVLRLAPNAELEVHVDADDRRAMRARRLVERLEAAGGTPGRAVRPWGGIVR